MPTKKLFFSCIVLMALTGAGTALWGQTGGFAYVANCGAPCSRPALVGSESFNSNVSAYTIDRTTGALALARGSRFLAGDLPRSVTVDRTGQFASVANLGSNDVSAYTIDGTTGALAPVAGSPFPAGSGPRSVRTTAGPPPPVL